MPEDNEEYEVESVVAAKVEKEGPSRKRKKPKLVWSYRVRWKGYSPDEDTWEPAESFADSEQILEAFWSRVSTNGRDKNDLTLFKFGEEIFPSGPPTRKKSSTKLNPTKPGPSQSNKAPSDSSATAQTSKRRRSPDLEIVEPPPSKKVREASIEIISPPPTQAKGKAPATPIATSSLTTPSRTRSQRRKTGQRPASPEVIPPSDGELDEDILTKSFISASKSVPNVIDTSASPDLSSHSTKKLKRVELPNLPLLSESRATRSRIQTMEPGIAVSDGALSAKSKAMRQSEQNPGEQSNKRAKRMKAGPGRSSSGYIANTSDKGVLKSVRPRRNRAKAVEDAETSEPEVILIENTVETAPPTGEELLQASGLRKEDVEALEDFDEDMEDVAAVAAAVDPTEEPKTPDIDTHNTPLATRVQRVTQLLFPTRSSEPDVDSKLLKTSTIFGPLGLDTNKSPAPQSASHHVSLKLDSSLSIPVIIEASNEVFHSFETTSGDATPGKFYSPSACDRLLASVRATGTPALVELANDAFDEDKRHYAILSKRLHEGDLFVACTGVQSWIFCSSSNTVASQRLNIPSHLLNQSNKLLVSKIEIVDYNGYADAAADADSRRWSQYLTSVSAF